MAQSTTVIPADLIGELQQHIANNQPKALGPDDVRQGFCSAWPSARVGLQGLQTVLRAWFRVSRCLPAQLFR